jgi:hypothetical protein
MPALLLSQCPIRPVRGESGILFLESSAALPQQAAELALNRHERAFSVRHEFGISHTLRSHSILADLRCFVLDGLREERIPNGGRLYFAG